MTIHTYTYSHTINRAVYPPDDCGQPQEAIDEMRVWLFEVDLDVLGFYDFFQCKWHRDGWSCRLDTSGQLDRCSSARIV